MGTEYQLKEGDELDAICHRHYGELPGALEAVLRANWDLLNMFDDHGKVRKLSKPSVLILPELKRPTTITNSIRVFE
jgi:phage tail protein X